jgi:spermidine synthase
MKYVLKHPDSASIRRNHDSIQASTSVAIMNEWYDEIFNDRLRFGLKVRRFLYSGRSALQKIDVFETDQFGRALALDGIYMTSEGDEYFYHEMLVHPAMATAPAIQRVLVIGGGDGGTVREVLRYPEVEKVVMVEIDPMVVEVCRKYLGSIGTAWDDPRLELIFEDGVSFAWEADVGPFDVILLDGSDPAGPAEGLFSEEFYRGCKRLLAPNGVFALQSESPVLFREAFITIVQLLRGIFPIAQPYFGTVPLYGAGLWSWTHASHTVDPLAVIDDRVNRIESSTRYYNRAIHQAAFALPNEIKKTLEEL